ncbi:GTPase activating factor [Balamuthia mandrillaris]
MTSHDGSSSNVTSTALRNGGIAEEESNGLEASSSSSGRFNRRGLTVEIPASSSTPEAKSPNRSTKPTQQHRLAPSRPLPARPLPSTPSSPASEATSSSSTFLSLSRSSPSVSVKKKINREKQNQEQQQAPTLQSFSSSPDLSSSLSSSASPPVPPLSSSKSSPGLPRPSASRKQVSPRPSSTRKPLPPIHAKQSSSSAALLNEKEEALLRRSVSTSSLKGLELEEAQQREQRDKEGGEREGEREGIKKTATTPRASSSRHEQDQIRVHRAPSSPPVPSSSTGPDVPDTDSYRGSISAPTTPTNELAPLNITSTSPSSHNKSLQRKSRQFVRNALRGGRNKHNKNEDQLLMLEEELIHDPTSSASRPHASSSPTVPHAQQLQPPSVLPGHYSASMVPLRTASSTDNLLQHITPSEDSSLHSSSKSLPSSPITASPPFASPLLHQEKEKKKFSLKRTKSEKLSSDNKTAFGNGLKEAFRFRGGHKTKKDKRAGSVSEPSSPSDIVGMPQVSGPVSVRTRGPSRLGTELQTEIMRAKLGSAATSPSASSSETSEEPSLSTTTNERDKEERDDEQGSSEEEEPTSVTTSAVSGPLNVTKKLSFTDVKEKQNLIATLLAEGNDEEAMRIYQLIAQELEPDGSPDSEDANHKRGGNMVPMNALKNIKNRGMKLGIGAGAKKTFQLMSRIGENEDSDSESSHESDNSVRKELERLHKKEKHKKDKLEKEKEKEEKEREKEEKEKEKREKKERKEKEKKEKEEKEKEKDKDKEKDKEKKQGGFWKKLDNKKKLEKPKLTEEQAQAYDTLLSLLLKQDLLLGQAACWCLPRVSRDSINPKIARFYLNHDCCIELISKLISAEVKSTVEAGTLFRSNSPVSNLMSKHATLVGKAFLRRTIAPFIDEVIDRLNKGVGFEIDPIKLADSSQSIEENIKNMMDIASVCLQMVLENHSSCPASIRRLCQELKNAVSEKFPGSLYTVVGGYYFLRFLCPAIISPEGFGVVPGPQQGSPEKVTVEVRRVLILVSKLLQQLANSLKFGAKEPYMEPLNPFIDDNLARMHQFFDKLAIREEEEKAQMGLLDFLSSIPPPDEEEEEFEPDPVFDEEMKPLFHRLFAENMPAVEEFFAKEDIRALREGIDYDPLATLRSCLEILDPVLESTPRL